MRRREFFLLTAAMSGVAAAGALQSQAWSAEGYPQRAVRLIIPYPPGGAGDIVGRMLAGNLTEAFGQQVVVDNRGGGGQIIATQLAANAQPDGHTLFLSSATHAINPALRKGLPYDTLKDFAPITLVAQSPLVFVAHPSLGVGSIKDLIAAAKARPGRINYASSGPGTGGHMSVELLKSLTGIDVVHIPYKGAGPALIDVIAGQVQMMCTSPLPAMPHVKAGRLRALAMTSLKRAPSAPGVPTVSETIPGYQSTLWYALLAPAGTPQGIIRKAHTETVKALTAPDIRQRLVAFGAEPVGNSPQELQAFLREEIERWTRLVRQANISLDRS
ncbi:MAG: tripartite tricarboxylate transporter substrate binding protein [Betaproteobacteria bacterium]|nr:tripartite tricarboxylate transporter substrate binding protein [Betaproteobacteria bacterium]